MSLIELIVILLSILSTITGIGLYYYAFKTDNPVRRERIERRVRWVRAHPWQIFSCFLVICIIMIIIWFIFSGIEKERIIGKNVGDVGNSLIVYPEFYDPSGLMGDLGDITIQKNDSIIRFYYSGMGNEPHESENKYLDNGTLNPRAARFSGVMFLNPANNYGDQLGWDLRNFHKSLDWEARTVDGKCNVKFLVGGIRWKWINGKIFRDVPYPDSMNARNFGIKTLNTSWQKFSANLSNIPENEFSNVIGGFGWTISQDDQDFTAHADTGLQNSGICTIEVKNIQYR